MTTSIMINENGYTLLQRSEGAPVEVWSQANDSLCHVARGNHNDFFAAFQCAHSNPPPVVVEVPPPFLSPPPLPLR